MTFCIGMKSEEGLLAIADTRITSGTEASVAKKISVHTVAGGTFFVATSGLRSVRDKTLTYFDDDLRRGGRDLGKMYQAVNSLSEMMRRVRVEDGSWLQEGGLRFDINCIVGGQLREDPTHRLFHVYPEGNWVEVGAGTPYVIIGESSYGKALLDRVWRYERSLAEALTCGLLSFDATRISATDVDPPIDVVLYRSNAFSMHERRFGTEALQAVSDFWNEAMLDAERRVAAMTSPLFAELETSEQASTRDIPGVGPAGAR